MVSSSELLGLAREEIAVMRRLGHPNLLPLLGSALARVATASGVPTEVNAVGRGGGVSQGLVARQGLWLHPA